MKRKTIGVLGLGIFGKQLALRLAQNPVDVMVMDADMENLDEIANHVELAVQGDFTKLDQLEEAGFSDCDIAIVTTTEKLETGILSIMNLEQLGVQQIIAKAKSEDYREVLERVGAHRVIIPEIEVANSFAQELLYPNFHSIMTLGQDYHFIEFKPVDQWLGQSIDVIDFRKKYGVNLIAMQPASSKELSIQIDPNYLIQEGDRFFGMTDNDYFVQDVLS